MILRLEILFQKRKTEISKLHWAKMKMRHQTTMNLDHNQKDLDQTPNQQQRQERFFGFFGYGTISKDSLRIGQLVRETRIPTVKLKIPGKLFLNANPELLLHSSYSF